MGLKGQARDMNRWREELLDSNVHYPGESREYRRARNELLEREAELRQLNELVAAQRRALPPGGLIKEDYIFESAADGSKVKISELFKPGKNSLVIFNMMFPRWPEDERASVPGGQTAKLPLVEQPCPSCTSVVDGLEGAAFHLADRTNLVVVAKTSAERLGTYAKERGWRDLRLVSSQNNTFNSDYHAETSDGVQRAVLHVFTRNNDEIRHHWTSEMTFKRGDTSSLDPVWSIFGVLDLTLEGRGTSLPSLICSIRSLQRGERILAGAHGVGGDRVVEDSLGLTNNQESDLLRSGLLLVSLLLAIIGWPRQSLALAADFLVYDKR